MPHDLDTTRLASPFYTESHNAWREQLQRFVTEHISPHVNDWDEACELPEELWKKAADIGLLQMGYPEIYGGISEGIDIFHKIIGAEELSRCGAGGVYATLMIHNIALPPIVAHDPDGLQHDMVSTILKGDKHISLAITEPSGGSDVANLKTRARKHKNSYIVNGSKTFITGGMRADFFTTAVRTGGDGIGGISLLLIDAKSPGLSRTRLDKKQGWWCSDTTTLYFDDVYVPAENLIGPENTGFTTIVNNFNEERLILAATSISAARVCLEESINWAQERRTFGKRLADHQVIRHKIAEMLGQINSTQSYLDTCAWQVRNSRQSTVDIALLKILAARTMEFCAREAMQILGGASYIRGNRVERIYREVRVNAIGGGSEEIMRDLAARQINL